MTIVRKTGLWLSAKVGDELIMMSLERERYIGLSEVGARIWELVETPRSVDDLCACLVGEYDVAADRVRAETESFLRELAGCRAVEFDAV